MGKNVLEFMSDQINKSKDTKDAVKVVASNYLNITNNIEEYRRNGDMVKSINKGTPIVTADEIRNEMRNAMYRGTYEPEKNEENR